MLISTSAHLKSMTVRSLPLAEILMDHSPALAIRVTSEMA